MRAARALRKYVTDDLTECDFIASELYTVIAQVKVGKAAVHTAAQSQLEGMMGPTTVEIGKIIPIVKKGKPPE